MYKARRYLGSKSLVNLYHSYIYIYIYIYITILFIVSNHGAMLHIIILSPYLNLKNFKIKIITFSYYNAHTEPIFNNLNILPLYKLNTDVQIC